MIEQDRLQKFFNAGAWFKLIFGSIYAVFALAMLIVFFRARQVFEIRARGAYLVTFLGMILLINQGLNIDLHVIVLFHTTANYYRNSLAVFVYTFTVASVYISRVIRLAVAYCPRFRRAVPWLMSERLLIAGSASIGILSLIIPLYYRYSLTGEDSQVRYIELQTVNIWRCTVALQAVQAALLPVVWMIDDLFHISRELIVIIVLGLIQSVVNKLVMEDMLEDEVKVWINPPNMGFLTSCILFGLSVIDPVRRLIFDPMAKSSPAMARAHARSKREIGTVTESVSMESSRTYKNNNSSFASTCSYEKVAASPAMAEAFRAFANRALCQECVWFLEEVAKYNNEDYNIAAAQGGTQVFAFQEIVKRFIVDGAPDEINISGGDRKKILLLFATSTDTFETLDPNELRNVFRRSYSDVRFMLESNIMSKFTETEEFRKVANKRPRPRRRPFFLPLAIEPQIPV